MLWVTVCTIVSLCIYELLAATLAVQTFSKGRSGISILLRWLQWCTSTEKGGQCPQHSHIWPRPYGCGAWSRTSPWKPSTYLESWIPLQTGSSEHLSNHDLSIWNFFQMVWSSNLLAWLNNPDHLGQLFHLCFQPSLQIRNFALKRHYLSMYLGQSPTETQDPTGRPWAVTKY